MKRLSFSTSCFLVACLACGGLLGCDDIIGALGLTSGGAKKLSDEDAFAHLRQNYQAAPTTDLEAVNQIIDDEIGASSPVSGRKMRKKAVEESDEAIDLKRSVIHARKAIDVNKYGLLNDELFKKEQAQKRVYKGADNAYTVDLSTLKGDEYYIPNANKIPVRDQGSRGTCAAFAGIGTIEYAALNGDASELPTLDLSEQRFYYISRPDIQSTGGSLSDGGSFYGTGFEESSKKSTFDIPLETDCPYNNKSGSNELQVPQKASCSKGAVRVKKVIESGDSASYFGAQGIINMLNKGYAVPFASPLSSNWENNNGLITKKDFTKQGSSVHAGGHAYLIVGYKKVSADEGGVCFIVKNSWGTGWGIKGFACQTLAWTEAIDRSNYQFLQYEYTPIGVQLELREDLKNTNTLPPDNTEDEDDVANNLPDEEPVDSDAQEADEIPVDPPKTVPDESDYVDTNLLGNTESYYKVQTASLDKKLFVRGILRGDGTTTALVLDQEGSKLYYDGDEVGKFKDGTLTLCTGEWAHLCSLRYRDANKKFYLQFRDDDLRSVKAEEISEDKGKWHSVDLGSGQYGLFVPNAETAAELIFDPKIYLRLGSNEASRLSLKVNAWNKIGIRLQGEDVGELDLTSPLNSSLCSGDYAETCSIIGKDKVHIFPTKTKSRKDTSSTDRKID